MTDPDTWGTICKTISDIAPSHTPATLEDEADPHAFLPLHIAPPSRSSSASVSVAACPASHSGGAGSSSAITGPSIPPSQYGYLAYRPGTTVGLAQDATLADILSAELTARGAPSTPFIFSALALDVSRAKINRLSDAFLGTCVIGIGKEKEEREKRWREEVRFGAGVHEIGFVLRWAMARHSIIRLRIFTLSFALPPALRSLLHALLTLLSRIVAYTAKSGHTPPSLSPLFGPLVFGLGKEGAGFSGVYERYLASTTAMEHLLLAFFRAQDAETVGNAPTRSREWIAGYPAPNHPPTAFAATREWECMTGGGREPRYSDNFKKRLDLSTGAVPATPSAAGDGWHVQKLP
ncbi:hypothetical protein HDZ31DRAFT_66810 [Schizophyllum fasciatum]